MRNDYRVLSKGPLDGPWDLTVLRQKYVEGGFNGLNLRFMSPPPFSSLDFLDDYTSLEYLEITTSKLNNDLPAFRPPVLKELVLLTKSTRPIPGFASPGIVRLGFDDRPGKELVAGLRKLRDLLIWRWRGTDLRFLGLSPPPLEVLQIEGMHQPVTLDGIEECHNLAELQVRESRVESLRPLRGLKNLKDIKILPDYRSKTETELDLEDLTGLGKLELLNLICVGKIRSLRPLLRMPSLRELRLGPIEVADGDMSPLNRLPPYVHFGGQLAERLRREKIIT